MNDMSRSELEIEAWLKKKPIYIKKYGGTKQYEEAVSRHKASLSLGREFGESTESYFKRKDLKKFIDWKP